MKKTFLFVLMLFCCLGSMFCFDYENFGDNVEIVNLKEKSVKDIIIIYDYTTLKDYYVSVYLSNGADNILAGRYKHSYNKREKNENYTIFELGTAYEDLLNKFSSVIIDVEIEGVTISTGAKNNDLYIVLSECPDIHESKRNGIKLSCDSINVLDDDKSTYYKKVYNDREDNRKNFFKVYCINASKKDNFTFLIYGETESNQLVFLSSDYFDCTGCKIEIDCFDSSMTGYKNFYFVTDKGIFDVKGSIVKSNLLFTFQ